MVKRVKFTNGDIIRMEVNEETEEFIKSPLLFVVLGYMDKNYNLVAENDKKGCYIRVRYITPFGDNKEGAINFFDADYIHRVCTLVKNDGFIPLCKENLEITPETKLLLRHTDKSYDDQFVIFTIKELLDYINADRSDGWTDYDMSDWDEGMREFTDLYLVDFINVGSSIYWNDPDAGLTSGEYIVNNVVTDGDGFLISVFIDNNRTDVMDVLLGEIEFDHKSTCERLNKGLHTTAPNEPSDLY